MISTDHAYEHDTLELGGRVAEVFDEEFTLGPNQWWFDLKYQLEVLL